MENNKQSSVEMMWDEIDNLFPFKDSVEAQKFCALLDKAKAMHKEEIEDAYWEGGQDIPMNAKQCEQYYDNTFGGNK